MKKLMSIAVAMAAGIVLATDGIESENTVGYLNQGTLPVGYTMVASQFIVPGTTSTVDLLAYMNGTFTPGTYATRFTACPMIKIYKEGDGYTTFYYMEDAVNSKDEDVTGWADGNGDLAEEILISPGDAVWVSLPNATASGVNLSGQVFSDATKSKDCVAGYSMLSSPYPSALKFGELTWTGLVAGTYTTRYTACPMVKVYTEGDGYTTYYYMSDAIDSNDDEVTGWADGNGDLVETTQVLAPAGKGFWVILPTGSTKAAVEFSNPNN